ncbi:MAG TPA: response regulator [Candidatus Limnocylindria bacterium]|jgi:two-component system KDP operon response regulator KdpE|nr:response regulator [Candidatus Limnocylindria bacterium]
MSVEPIKQPSVLVVDDEVQIRRLLRVCLEKNGYHVIEAATGIRGLEEAAQYLPSLVLLDLGLPEMDGLEVLRRLREWSQVPVLVLSVRGHDEDKIAALDGGADDYVTKPFSTGEVLARLRVAQRHNRDQTLPPVFQAGDLKVDLANRLVRIRGEKVRLTATEYSLLRYFVQHAGKVLTHGQLLREIWETDNLEKIGHLRVYVTHLREKLERQPSEPDMLLTEPGIGYRLVVPE